MHNNRQHSVTYLLSTDSQSNQAYTFNCFAPQHAKFFLYCMLNYVLQAWHKSNI